MDGYLWVVVGIEHLTVLISLKSRPRCARKDLNNKDTSNFERKVKRSDCISRIRSQISTKNEWSDCWSKRDRTDDMF